MGGQVQLINSVAGFFTPPDAFQHILATIIDGRLYHVSFSPQQGPTRQVLGIFGSTVSIAGYFTPTDGYQHALVAMPTGDVFEVFWQPNGGVGEDLLAHFDAPIIDIAGFFTPDDTYQHAIVATADGNLYEVYFSPQFGTSETVLTSFNGILAIDSFYTPDDNDRHVIVATSDGNITEVYYNPRWGLSQTPLAHFDGVVDIASFYTPDDKDRHVIVATSDGTVTEVYYNPRWGLSQTQLATFTGLEKISAYYTPTDGNRHVIVGTSDGNITEIYYNPRWGLSQDVLATFTLPAPTFEDIGPNTANTVTGDPWASSAGVIIGLASDPTSTLYALSLNAGVWKSVLNNPWVQLPGSPPNGCCIAVDPNNSSHVVVGEHDGFTISPALNHCGVWESFDAGNSWTYTFNPLTLNGCQSQSVRAVGFSLNGTLFIGTSCGIGRWNANKPGFDFTLSPPGIEIVTGFAVSETNHGPLMWARTINQVLFSPDDGLTWTIRDIPPTMPVPQTVIGNITIPAGTYTVFPDYFDAGGNDYLSLAAYDATALIVAKLYVPQDSPIAHFDPQCDPNSSQYVPTKTLCDPAGNLCALLMHNSATNSWSLQYLAEGDGTGLGGRRFIKSFILNRQDLPMTVGARIQMIFCAGQDIAVAQGVNNDGTIQWDTSYLHTVAGGSPQAPVHSDIWDFHLAPDGSVSWIGCDGGVYQKINTFPGSTQGWMTWHDGLHTHHGHTLTLLRTNHVNRSRLAYPTTDNDAWHRSSSAYISPPADWQVRGRLLGDAGWTAGDSGNIALALLVRTPSFAAMTAFGDPPPSGANIDEGRIIVLNPHSAFDGPLFLQFIQTLKGETPRYPLLDAVMLATQPLGGVPDPTQGVALFRNREFAKNPDFAQATAQAWPIEVSNLPSGTQGFWVSVGHTLPVYYLYAVQAGQAVLYKNTPDGWQSLNDKININHVPGFSLLYGSNWGPAFVNPYDPNRVYVLTSDGVKFSTNANSDFASISFQDDVVLTALITDSGKFRLVGSFNPDGSLKAVGNRGHSELHGAATLSHMAFFRDNPAETVAASAFTGAFYNNGDGNWHSLSPYLPRPLSTVSSVGIDNEGIYAVTEGRGIVRILNYRFAPLASYFQVAPPNQSGLIATLCDATSAPFPASVDMRIASFTGDTLFNGQVSSDSNGQIFLPSGFQPGNLVIELHFAGTANLAPCETGLIR